MKVQQAMSTNIVTIEESQNCHEAVEKMVRHRVRHLPVVTWQGKLCGIVTDRGGLLSHAAIVAREYGMPAVVGTSDATTMVPDGARVRIDGGSGEVQVLS